MSSRRRGYVLGVAGVLGVWLLAATPGVAVPMAGPVPQALSVGATQSGSVSESATAGEYATRVPRVRLASVGRYLRINIDPNRPGLGSWAFIVQRRVRSWPTSTYVTVGRYRTQGASETRSVLLSAHKYRVVVPAQHGFARAVATVEHFADVTPPSIIIDETPVLTTGLPQQPGRALLHLAVKVRDLNRTRPAYRASGIARVVVRRGTRVLGQMRSIVGGELPRDWAYRTATARLDWDGVVPDHWRTVKVRAVDHSGNASQWRSVSLEVAPKPRIRWRQVDSHDAWLGDTACGVSTAGAAYCWGANAWGLLGGGTGATTTTVPVPVKGLRSGVASVAVEGLRACAVRTDGSLWCWGRDRSWTGAPQPGDGDGDGDPVPPILTTPPVQIGGLPPVVSVSLSSRRACAVTTDGATWCWGDNRLGWLGVDSDADWVGAPTPVTGLGAGTTTAVDASGPCALTESGGVKCWGNYLVQEDHDRYASTVPVDLPGFTSGVVRLQDSCAVRTDGTAWCWGWGYAPFGERAGGYGPFPTSPRQVPGLSVPVVEYAAECARTAAGAVYCIGRDNSWAPVLGLRAGVASIPGHQDAHCALTRVGVGYCWGDVINGRSASNKPYRWTDSPMRIPNPA